MWKGVGDGLRETEMDEAIQWYNACGQIAKGSKYFLRDAAGRESCQHVMGRLTESKPPPEKCIFKGGRPCFVRHSIIQSFGNLIAIHPASEDL
jgi:hypothetical protein